MANADRERAATSQPGSQIERKVGKDRHRQPEPEATEGERVHREPDAREGEQGKADEARRQQACAHIDRGQARQPCRQRPCEEGRGREDADDRRPRDRRMTPSGDHKQDGEEQRTHKRTKHEAEAQVRGQQSGERRTPALLDEGFSADPGRCN